MAARAARRGRVLRVWPAAGSPRVPAYPLCVQRDDQVALGTVGTPFPNVELKLSPEGEVIVRGPCVFLGYYKNPEATANAIRDGWRWPWPRGSCSSPGRHTDRAQSPHPPARVLTRRLEKGYPPCPGRPGRRAVRTTPLLTRSGHRPASN